MRSFSFVALALALALAVTASAQETHNPQNQTIPKTWDKCISAGIGELWKTNTREPLPDKPLRLDMACSIPEYPCILDVCNSSPEVKDTLEDYVRATCKPEDVDEQIENIETNCWQFADHDAIAGHEGDSEVAAAAAFGV